jgi:hypothetical protein
MSIKEKFSELLEVSSMMTNSHKTRKRKKVEKIPRTSDFEGKELFDCDLFLQIENTSDAPATPHRSNTMLNYTSPQKVCRTSTKNIFEDSILFEPSDVSDETSPYKSQDLFELLSCDPSAFKTKTSKRLKIDG